MRSRRRRPGSRMSILGQALPSTQSRSFRPERQPAGRRTDFAVRQDHDRHPYRHRAGSLPRPGARPTILGRSASRCRSKIHGWNQKVPLSGGTKAISASAPDATLPPSGPAPPSGGGTWTPCRSRLVGPPRRLRRMIRRRCTAPDPQDGPGRSLAVVQRRTRRQAIGRRLEHDRRTVRSRRGISGAKLPALRPRGASQRSANGAAPRDVRNRRRSRSMMILLERGRRPVPNRDTVGGPGFAQHAVVFARSFREHVQEWVGLVALLGASCSRRRFRLTRAGCGHRILDRRRRRPRRDELRTRCRDRASMDESRPTFLLHAVRPVAKTPSSASGWNGPAGVAELVDALDLGSSDSRCGGSSPSARTIDRPGYEDRPEPRLIPRDLGRAVRLLRSFSLLSVAETVIRLTDSAGSRH